MVSKESMLIIFEVIAKARGVRQVGGVERVGGIVWKEIGAALLDLKCWFTAVRNNFSD